MQIEDTAIPEVKLVTPNCHRDDRGFFLETFRQKVMDEAAGREIVFVQDNHSLSSRPFTVRALHYQRPPHAQGKLVRCTRGSIADVAVDARVGSPTYGRHVKVILSADNMQQLWVPDGFLHGFVTLEPDTEVQYKCTDYYDRDCDGSVRWDDPALGIDWGFDPARAVLSDKDKSAPGWDVFDNPFVMG